MNILKALQKTYNIFAIIAESRDKKLINRGLPICGIMRGEEDCKKCPIYAVTGFSLCEGTNYYDIVGNKEFNLEEVETMCLFISLLIQIVKENDLGLFEEKKNKTYSKVNYSIPKTIRIPYKKL